jgi:AraC-like DNA-binding protein
VNAIGLKLFTFHYQRLSLVLELMKYFKSTYIEAAIHLLFWVFIFCAINVDWTADWFDKNIRPRRPAPLSVVIFPVLFYMNAFWAIPRYLSAQKWPIYIISFGLIFILPEFFRSGILSTIDNDLTFWDEFQSRDSFLLGQPNVFWMALTFSFGYRFTKDWFSNHIFSKKEQAIHSKNAVSITIVTTEEAEQIKSQLNDLMKSQKPYTNASLSLRDLAITLDTTEKKLSSVLNNTLNTSFYDYLNSLRIEEFIEKTNEGLLESMSIAGIANICGFNSKSSFYRAFKKETNMTPTEYLNKNNSL